MGAVTTANLETLGDLLLQLGCISPHRVRLHPAPGEGTEQDVIDIHDRTKRLYELVDGVLVEKVMGFPESVLACHLIKVLGTFIDQHHLGVVAGEAGMMRLMPRLVRIPDISFIGWDRLPDREVPDKSVPHLVPDLAVEVLSEGNTAKEMKRKLRDYFRAGVKLVWFVDAASRTVQVFTASDQSVVLTEAGTLDGGDVLPGLALPVKEVFAGVPHEAGPRPSRKRQPRSPTKKAKNGGKL
jgi:Uma2 family endonuclease